MVGTLSIDATSLINSFAARACLAAAGVLVLTTHPVFAENLYCPPRMPGPHPGFEQVGPVPAAHWLLRRMRLFNTSPNNAAAKELRPKQTVENGESYTSTWQFAGDEHLLMLCLYNGSGTYYAARPDPPPTLCVTHDDANGLTQSWCEEP
jgi:hypothetical protein